jgi:predicted XRE-type DNA-binding protein
VGLAVLNLLSGAAGEQPLICLIDDEQWLDQASAQVLTQAEVARVMGVSQARVSRMEHGDIERMQVESIAAYVAAIGGHLRLVADFDQATTTFIDYTDTLTA